MFPILYLCIFISIVPFSIQRDHAPVIQISTGKIKGEDKESRNDKKFFAYRGIPYATAKRFELPQPPTNWSDVRDAKEYGKKCIQYSTFEKKVVGSEDCHYINVFTPQTSDGLSKVLLPVMVYIHGSFMDGTAEIYRPHYFLDENVVLVTFDYRLNIFGFLHIDDDVVPGNLGLKDQVMALHWVQDNIRKFSGDKNRVTLFGAGDGASSVHLLMLSPITKGLFRKAITQSGSALKLDVIQKNPKQAAQRIARLMDCEKVLNATLISDNHCMFDKSTLIFECLKLVDAKKLAQVQQEAFRLARDPLTFFGPVIENPSKQSKESAVISEHPYSIISSGKQSRIPWMTGLNAQEGLVISGVISSDKGLVDKVDSSFYTTSPKLLQYDPSRTDVTHEIRRFYLSPNYATTTASDANISPSVSSLPSSATLYPNLYSNLPTLNSTIPIAPHTQNDDEFYHIHFEEQFQEFTNMFTDRLYAVGMVDAVKMQAQYSPVYMYFNNYEGQYSLLDVHTGKAKEPAPAIKKVSSWFKKNILGRTPQAPKHLGVCNGDELPLLFKYPELKIKENTRDYQMSKQLVKLWVQFATDETKMVFNNASWLPCSSGSDDTLRAMQFGPTEQDSSFGPLSDTFMTRVKFWSTLKYLAPFTQ